MQTRQHSHKLHCEDRCLGEVGDALDVDQLLFLFAAVDDRVDRLHLNIQLCRSSVKKQSNAFHSFNSTGTPLGTLVSDIAVFV